jgi:glycosyltransferase involved in cell wall biosynthesis
MSKQSIWIFKQNAVSPDMAGGTRQYDLGRELVRKGHKLGIFATSFSYTQHKEMKLSESEKMKVEDINGVKFIWIKTFPYRKNNWRRVINILDFAVRSYHVGRRIHRSDTGLLPPDVVIAFSVPLLAPLAAYYVARSFRAEFIMEVGDLWPRTLIDMGVLNENSLVAKGLTALEKSLYQRADMIITSLPFARDYIYSLGVNKKKIIWIPNGVNVSTYENIKVTRRSSDHFKVMYLGAHGPTNALDTLLDAARIIQQEGYEDIKLILVGDGSEKSKLVHRKDKLKLNNVEFREPVPKAKVPAILSDADAFVFNLADAKVFKYGIGSNKLFDYMAAGRPIIFSANSANNPVKEAKCGVSVPPRSPELLMKAIVRLYRSSLEERQVMGERGRHYVKENHNFATVIEKLERCIEEVSNAS